MEIGIIRQLATLNGKLEDNTISSVLKKITDILADERPEDLVVAYELIPETGGFPRPPAIYSGPAHEPEQMVNALDNVRENTTLLRLIQNWQLYCPGDDEPYEKWLFSNPKKKEGYQRLIASEHIKSFSFMPLGSPKLKLGAILINHPKSLSLDEQERTELELYQTVLSALVLSIYQHSHAIYIPKSRMVTAHMLYNLIADRFKRHIAALELEIQKSFGDHTLPTAIATHIDEAKKSVTELMRDLVIKASVSEDLLIDFRTISLYKALSSATSTLERALPDGNQLEIELFPVPPVFERQSLKLKQLIYALVMEVVGNSLKHGGPAEYICIQLGWKNNTAFVQVIDHGQGFDSKTTQFSEFGLGFWQHYICHCLAGRFEVSSHPGYGTNVIAKIPVVSPPRRNM